MAENSQVLWEKCLGWPTTTMERALRGGCSSKDPAIALPHWRTFSLTHLLFPWFFLPLIPKAILKSKCAITCAPLKPVSTFSLQHGTFIRVYLEKHMEAISLNAGEGTRQKEAVLWQQCSNDQCNTIEQKVNFIFKLHSFCVQLLVATYSRCKTIQEICSEFLQWHWKQATQHIFSHLLGSFRVDTHLLVVDVCFISFRSWQRVWHFIFSHFCTSLALSHCAFFLYLGILWLCSSSHHHS